MSLFSPARLLEYGSAVATPSPAEREADPQAEVLALFDELRNRLLRYSVSFGLSSHDAEDVLQEAFLALFKHLVLGRSRENLHGWMYRTTHNLSLKRRASVQGEARALTARPAEDVAETVEWMGDPVPNPEQVLLFRERQQRLQAVLRALPETDQVCLRLRGDGLRYRDIAATVGISLGSVAASLARSMERMQRTDAR